VRPRKRFAQHWLKDDRVLDRIVAAADLKDDDRVLEIGPGTGNLTRKLLPWVQSVLAVELDRDLCAKLVKQFGDRDNFILLQGDFLDLEFPELPPHFHNPNKVVANIPYNITGPILEKLLGTIKAPENRYESVVLLVQKEIAQRLTATPGSREFGALTVRVRYVAECEWVCDVPPKAFSPPPKVESAVIKLTPRSFPVPAQDPQFLAKLVKWGFANKRKMLRNNLKGNFDRDRLLEILSALSLDPKCRPEDVSVADWVKLSDRLGNELSS